jgi:site-specific DNA recombinase
VDEQLLSIPWQKPPSRNSRKILMPQGVSRNEVRPIRIERRARLVSAIAQGRRWLDEIVSGSVIGVEQIAVRQKCSMRQVNMTISLAFLAPAALENFVHQPKKTFSTVSAKNRHRTLNLK